MRWTTTSLRTNEDETTLGEGEAHRRDATKDLDHRVRRAFDLRTLPIICCLYVLSYVDRGNIGNAKTAGAQRDLALTSYEWSWVLNSFYLTYILFEWSTMLWKIFPAHVYVSVLCLLWGASAMSSGAARNLTQLIVTRCLLGMFEAAFGVGAPYFLSLLYKRQELGLRMSFLLGMSPLANTFASSLAYGITHIKGSSEPWRLLFIIEGAPTILFAPVVYFFLIDSPGTARFLSEEERQHAEERLQVRDTSPTKRGVVQWKQVLAGLADYKNYTHALIHFCCNFSFAALSNFLPSIVEGMGYLGAWLAACGVFPALSINITWLLNNQGGDSKKGAGLGVALIVGQCSSLISSVVFPLEDGPLYTKGCAIGCAFTGLIVLLSLALHFLLDRENRRRDELYGPVDPDAEVDVTDEGDYHVQFRYLT
uniref:Major facilitator superfamily (MFS) profile domain-containing protein n=1 Tax=Bionectria ochroleuca TaxID=29856 RepID=A0A0B7K4D0_BIOOC